MIYKPPRRKHHLQPLATVLGGAASPQRGRCPAAGARAAADVAAGVGPTTPGSGGGDGNIPKVKWMGLDGGIS